MAEDKTTRVLNKFEHLKSGDASRKGKFQNEMSEKAE